MKMQEKKQEKKQNKKIIKTGGKMANKKQNGMGLVSVLTIIFITLKLCDLIKWNWVWVLSPIWIYVAINLIAIISMIILFKLRK